MSNLYNELKAKLNPMQFEAATHINGPAVIMAGAGSGKTQTLVSRLSYLIDQGIPASSILMLTFTNKAADEMKDRAIKLLDDRCDKVTACTYHKFCNMMLRRHGMRIGLANYDILTWPETVNMIRYVESSDDRYQKVQGFPTADEVAKIMSYHINTGMPVADVVEVRKFGKYAGFAELIEELINMTRKYGKINGKLTYDDLLTCMNELLDNPDVCQSIARQYGYIMVDEFQDTNILQEEMILKLSVYTKNIMVVGDISQSIYAFRGAEVRNLQEFSTKMPDCKEIVLDYNYRSTQEILDFSNSVMDNNVVSWKYYDMYSPDKTGKKPVILRPHGFVDEGNAVFQTIEYYHDELKIPYSEIAVLFRSSGDSHKLEPELMAAGIDFDVYGGKKLMDWKCVGDVMAYLHLVSNSYDMLSWFRVLQLHPGLGPKIAKRIAEGFADPDFLIKPEYGNKSYHAELEKLNAAYRNWCQIKGSEDFRLLVETIIRFYLTLRRYSIEHSRMGVDKKRKELADLERDKSVLDSFKMIARQYTSLQKFLDDFTLDGIKDEERPTDRLTLSTIHSAKGLEWRVVIIMRCSEGIFPRLNRELWGSEEDEEELRCFYVAATRAKDFLVISSPDSNEGQVGATELLSLSKSHYLDKSESFYEEGEIEDEF